MCSRERESGLRGELTDRDCETENRCTECGKKGTGKCVDESF